MSQKIFNNNLVEIHKSKVTLTPNKETYVGICILHLGKVLMYQFHYDSSCKSKYYDDSNKLIVGKMKDERSNIAFKYLIELNLKMHLF